MVIAYLMKHHGWSLAEALAHAQKRRPIVRPNRGFLSQLQLWERKLRGEDIPTAPTEVQVTAVSADDVGQTGVAVGARDEAVLPGTVTREGRGDDEAPSTADSASAAVAARSSSSNSQGDKSTTSS